LTRREVRLGGRSVVPIEWTTNLNGEPICGALRKGKKAIWDEIKFIPYYQRNGLTPAEFKQQKPEMFAEIVCHNSPATDPTSHLNGRCRFCGAKSGAPIKTGKWAKLTTFSQPDLLEKIFQEEPHSDLKDELDIIHHLVDEKVNEALNEETASLADRAFMKLVQEFKEAWQGLDGNKVSKIVSQMEAHCNANIKQQRAKDESVKLIREYGNLAKTGAEIKKMQQDFLPVSEVVRNTVIIVTAIEGYLSDEQKVQLHRHLDNLIRGGNLAGFTAQTNSMHNLGRPENQRQAKEYNPIPAQLSPAVVLEEES